MNENNLIPIECILYEMKKQCKELKFSDVYKIEGHNVPRTTEILSSMMHEEYLMQWANSLGFKRQGYTSYMKEAANKGTYTHHAIEQFLKHGQELDMDQIPQLAKNSVWNAYHSFKEWWKCINDTNQIEIMAIEKRLVCKYFGGTLDGLLKINGKIWLIDFKTSNHMNYKFWLQLSSYAYMLKQEGIEVEGCLVLKLNKDNIQFEEHILDMNNPEHSIFFEQCMQSFLMMTVAYYSKLKVQSMYKKLS